MGDLHNTEQAPAAEEEVLCACSKCEPEFMSQIAQQDPETSADGVTCKFKSGIPGSEDPQVSATWKAGGLYCSPPAEAAATLLKGDTNTGKLEYEYEVVAGRNVLRRRTTVPKEGTTQSSGTTLGHTQALSIVKKLSWLDRLLPLLIILAMVGGVLMGVFLPKVRDALSGASSPHIAGVSLPIALGLWLMMLPVLIKACLLLKDSLIVSGSLRTSWKDSPSKICCFSAFGIYGAKLVDWAGIDDRIGMGLPYRSSRVS